MNILYIDDDQRDIELFLLKARQLEPSMEITTANSSTDALKETESKSFECIVADFRLDNEDGLHLLTELRSKGVTSPIVFFTGMGNESIASEALRRGASDYFVKDFDTDFMRSFFHRLHQLSNSEPLATGSENVESILYFLPDLFLALDLDGKPLAANGPARAMFGLGSDLGRDSIFDLLPKEDAKSLRTYLNSCLVEKQPSRLHELDLPGLDGEKRKFEINASAILEGNSATGICLIARDISSRVEKIDSENKRVKSWRIFSEATQEGLVIHDNGIIVDVNDSFARIVGVPRPDLIGRNAKDFVVAEHQRILEKNIIENNEEPYVVNAHREDGVPIVVELQGSRVYSEGKSYRVVAVRDLTKERSVERDLREKTEKLESFNSMVSHDLRTPLWRIDTYADMIDAAIEKKDYKTVQHSISKLRESVTHTTNLISDLLTYSRIKKEELTRETVNLTHLAREAYASVNEIFLNKNAEVHIEDGITAQGDIGMLRIVMENLLNNACKYSSKRSKPKIHFGVEFNRDESIYFVSDNGVGFPPDQREEIFLPFRRLHSDAEYSGTGVGLATVKRIVEMHNGRVWAESDPDAGATIFFTLG